MKKAKAMGQTVSKEIEKEILETVERHTLEHDSALAKEAYRYLENLKSTNNDLHDRIYAARYQIRRK